MRRRMFVLSAVIALVGCVGRVTVREPITPERERQGGVSGVVRDSQSRAPLPNALVILQGGTPEQTKETMTNSRGVYWFSNLDAGAYTLEVVYGAAAQTREFTHDGTNRVQADFAIDPEAQLISALRGPAPPRSGCS